MFVETHVKRLFKEAGFEVTTLNGDRGGIVQGDGLDLVVDPDLEALSVDFSDDASVLRQIAEDARGSNKLAIELYGGSASSDLEGIYIDEAFLAFVKERAVEVYYKAQNEVNAIFDAEDAPDRRWDGARDAYVGTAAEFAAETADGGRLFVRVNRIADQSFDAYGSGDEVADLADVADILSGRSSHGTIEIQIYEISASNTYGGITEFDLPFAEVEYEPCFFRPQEADRIITGRGLVWTRSENEAFTLELAAELADEEEEHAVAVALRAEAAVRGSRADFEETAENVPAPR